MIFQDAPSDLNPFLEVTATTRVRYTHNFNQVGDDYVRLQRSLSRGPYLLGCAGLAGLVSWRVRKNRTKARSNSRHRALCQNFRGLKSRRCILSPRIVLKQDQLVWPKQSTSCAMP